MKFIIYSITKKNEKRLKIEKNFEKSKFEKSGKQSFKKM